MSRMNDIKSFLLILLIALAATLNSRAVAAAQPETLTVAGGCFWCVESDFEKVPGVTGAVSGFAGGNVDAPTYKQVTQGGTGHYEAVQITFDPDIVTRGHLLHLFLRSVDPTDSGGQFCDRGDSYRTAIFVSNQAERATADAAIAQAEKVLGQRIVTPILENKDFFPAEAYHQDYYKGRKLILTRFGPKRQSEAYKRYREACGRDARVMQLWGDAAPFAKGH